MSIRSLWPWKRWPNSAESIEGLSSPAPYDTAPSSRNTRASVNPTMNCGFSRASGNGTATARPSASHNGVSTRLVDAGSSISTSISTRSNRSSPSARRKWAVTSSV